MIDGEKVIKGLGLCMIPGTGGCDDCTYFGKGMCQMLLAEDAILLLKEQKKAIDFQSDRLDELLKAQEPVKPVLAIDNDGDWLCGNCYQSVDGEEELDASGFMPVKFNFCPNCGRAVKWE